jgi:acetyl esterase
MAALFDQVSMVFKAQKMQVNKSPDIWTQEYVESPQCPFQAEKYNKILDKDTAHDKWWNQCDVETIVIPGGSGQDMEVLVCKKKGSSAPERPLMVYTHGGGGIAGKAIHLGKVMARLCVQSDWIVANVEWRLGPQTRCPDNHRDMVAAIKYFNENAAKHGTAAGKISIGGDSGGAWPCAGACLLLGREDPALPKQLVRTCNLMYPMIGNALVEKAEVPPHLVFAQKMVREIFRQFATDPNDLDAQKDDCLMYPNKASIEELKLWPGTILQTGEFDFLREETMVMIPKLKEAGVYLDHADYAECAHGEGSETMFKHYDRFWDDWQAALKKWAE